MITRIWHGWTTPDRAHDYETLLTGEIIPGILARRLPGFRGIRVLRRDLGDEVEFATLMTFDSHEGIERFVGSDQDAAYVPDAAKRLLSSFDTRARHFELRAEFAADPSDRPIW